MIFILTFLFLSGSLVAAPNDWSYIQKDENNKPRERTLTLEPSSILLTDESSQIDLMTGSEFISSLNLVTKDEAIMHSGGNIDLPGSGGSVALRATGDQENINLDLEPKGPDGLVIITKGQIGEEAAISYDSSISSLPFLRKLGTLLTLDPLSTGALKLKPGTMVVEEDLPKYAVFNLPLGGPYTDFELKATTDGWDTMVYFYHSPDPNKSFVTDQVWAVLPDVFFTDSQYVGSPTTKNQRFWRKQSSTQSIAEMRTNSNSVISGVVVVVRDLGSINPNDPNLVWSWCKMTPTGYEEDNGGKSIWTPIAPQWVKQPFTP